MEQSIKNGFNFKFIINKNYEYLEFLIKDK